MMQFHQRTTTDPQPPAFSNLLLLVIAKLMPITTAITPSIKADVLNVALAHAITLACSPETEKLVATANRDGDSKVAAAIRQDSKFRAKGYVLKARGQLIF